MSSNEATSESPTPITTEHSKDEPSKEKSSKVPLTALLILGCGAVGLYAALGSSPPRASSLPETPSATPVDAVEGDSTALRGTVKEVIQVSSYTYLRVQPAAGAEFWAAVTKTSVSEGASVAFDGAELMTNFSSKELDRTFDQIYFARLAGGTGADPHAGGQFAPPTAEEGAAAKKAAALVAEEIVVPETKKAEGSLGHTVGELYERSAALSGKTVRVRGTVVKLTRRVMNTNFLHVRDGSGDPAHQTHDIVMKVAEEPPTLGKQALFEGTLATNVDLGAGYSYPVLLENARVIPE